MDYQIMRSHMVKCQLRPQGINEPELLKAFESLPRERFVPERLRSTCYLDKPLEVETNRYLLDAVTLAEMIRVAKVQPEESVLLIGSGSGYMPALLAQFADTVLAVEENEKMYQNAQTAFNHLELGNVVLHQSMLSEGWKENKPYSIIFVNGGLETVPKAIESQLDDGGRIVCIMPDEKGVGHVTKLIKNGDGFSNYRYRRAPLHVLPGFYCESEFCL